jgi:hypothetical protein
MATPRIVFAHLLRPNLLQRPTLDHRLRHLRHRNPHSLITKAPDPFPTIHALSHDVPDGVDALDKLVDVFGWARDVLDPVPGGWGAKKRGESGVDSCFELPEKGEQGGGKRRL